MGGEQLCQFSSSHETVTSDFTQKCVHFMWNDPCGTNVSSEGYRSSYKFNWGKGDCKVTLSWKFRLCIGDNSHVMAPFQFFFLLAQFVGSTWA